MAGSPGMARAIWYRWRSASSCAKGPWRTRAQDTVEAGAKALAADWRSGGSALVMCYAGD